MNKKDILLAIFTLIENYKGEVYAHGLKTCPLCQLFFVDSGGIRQLTSECTICPNVSFAKRNDYRGCTERGNFVRALNFDLLTSTPTLIEFWQKIYDLYESKDEEVLLAFEDELQEEIRTIANAFIS